MERRGFLKGFLGAIGAATVAKGKPKWKVDEDPEPMPSGGRSREEDLLRMGYSSKEAEALVDAGRWWDKHADVYLDVSDAICITSDVLC
jgi:hypothetical protein